MGEVPIGTTKLKRKEKKKLITTRGPYYCDSCLTHHSNNNMSVQRILPANWHMSRPSVSILLPNWHISCSSVSFYQTGTSYVPVYPFTKLAHRTSQCILLPNWHILRPSVSILLTNWHILRPSVSTRVPSFYQTGTCHVPVYPTKLAHLTSQCIL